MFISCECFKNGFQLIIDFPDSEKLLFVGLGGDRGFVLVHRVFNFF